MWLNDLASFASGAFVAAWIIVFLIRRKILDEITDLPRSSDNVDGLLSIIVPVRNEERFVARCLSSILRCEGVQKEVIVVDDNSTDATWDVLRTFAERGVKTVRAGQPPEGWMGKSWACHVGYLHSKGDWLLFTDADAEFSPEILSHAMNAAVKNGLDFVSVYPRFRLNSLLHRFGMPIMLTGFYFFGKPHLVKTGKSAFAFGSFILLKREAYERIDGHRAVRDAVLEDRALALAAQSSGLRSEIFKAFDRLTTSWNDDSRTLWNGMIRIFLPIALKNPVKTVMVFSLLTFVCLLIPTLALLTGSYLQLAISHAAAWVVTGLESRRHGSSFIFGFFWPIGAAAVMGAALMAMVKSKLNPTVTWRGRKYLITRGENREKIVVIS